MNNKKNDNNQSETRVDEWMFFVDEDLKVAEIIFHERENSSHLICFHSQQAIEKAIKALLVKEGQRVPKIHQLLRLAKLLKDKSLEEEFLEELKFVDRFYVPTRYPEALAGSLSEGLPNRSDAKRALKCAKEIVVFVRKRLEK